MSLHLGSYFIYYCEIYKFKTKHELLITLVLARVLTPVKRHMEHYRMVH